MSIPSTAHVPTATLENFESFRAGHGPIESPIAERVLSDFFSRAIGAAFEAKRMCTNGFKSISSYVAEEFTRNSADVLAVLELAAEWSADPLQAAETQLRPALEAKAAAERDELKRRQEAELRAELQRRADELMASLEIHALGQAAE